MANYVSLWAVGITSGTSETNFFLKTTICELNVHSPNPFSNRYFHHPFYSTTITTRSPKSRTATRSGSSVPRPASTCSARAGGCARSRCCAGAKANSPPNFVPSSVSAARSRRCSRSTWTTRSSTVPPKRFSSPTLMKERQSKINGPSYFTVHVE